MDEKVAYDDVVSNSMKVNNSSRRATFPTRTQTMFIKGRLSCKEKFNAEM